MTKQDFIIFVDKALGQLIQYAELHANKNLPNEIEFKWAILNDDQLITGRNKIINSIVEKVFLSETEIYPCVDLIVDSISDDNKLIIIGRIAGFSPRPFQKGWSNRPGPFIYGINQTLVDPGIDIKSTEFIKVLKDKGLLFDL